MANNNVTENKQGLTEEDKKALVEYLVYNDYDREDAEKIVDMIAKYGNMDSPTESLPLVQNFNYRFFESDGVEFLLEEDDIYKNMKDTYDAAKICITAINTGDYLSRLEEANEKGLPPDDDDLIGLVPGLHAA
jgi:hypothetical protein